MLDKQKIKLELEREQGILLEQLKDIGRLNTETGEWEAIPEEQDIPESDSNEMADRFEDFEERGSRIDTLAARLNDILWALKNLNEATFGKCNICQKDIEQSRLEANPAARTCKKHLES